MSRTSTRGDIFNVKTKWARLARERESWQKREHREELRNSEHERLNRLKHFIIKPPTSSYSEKRREPCQFVSEGGKPAVRSKSPLIFLSCIKGTVLMRGYSVEQALRICTVYLILPASVYTHLGGISPKIHFACFFSPLHMCTEPSCCGSIVAPLIVGRFTPSHLFDKTALSSLMQQPVVQHNNTTYFCSRGGSPARWMCAQKGIKGWVCWWRGIGSGKI